MQGKYLDSLSGFTDSTFSLSRVLNELRINFQRVGFKRGGFLLPERLNNWSALLIIKWNACSDDREGQLYHLRMVETDLLSGWIDR